MCIRDSLTFFGLPVEANHLKQYNLDAKNTCHIPASASEFRNIAYESVNMTRQRFIELIASAFGLAGMALGSTERYGIACYAAAIPCLIYCVSQKKLWGLMPLNIAQGVVIAFNAWRVL